MKQRNIIITMACMFLVGTLLTGCGAESDMQQGNADLDAPLSLTASGETAPAMRAANGLYTSQTGFSGGEKIKVYMKAGSTTKSADYDVSAPYVSGGLKKSDLNPSSGETALYYPSGATGTVDVYGVYPSTSTTTHTVSYNQTGNDAYMESDLMYARIPVSWTSLAEKLTLKPNLPFQHQLVKLIVKIVKFPDVWQVQEVKMSNVKRKVSVTPSATQMTVGTATAATDDSGNYLLIAGQETASSVAETKEYTYACVFPAQTWGSGAAFADFLTVKADGVTTTYQLKKTFNAGKEYMLTINLNGLALGGTVEIDGWTDGSEKVINPTEAEGGTLHLAEVADQVYKGTAWEPTPAVTSGKGGTATTLTKGTHYDLIYFNNINAGEATILAVGKTGTDYEGQIGLKNFNITKAPLTIKADNKSRQYNTNNPTWTFTYTGFKNGETSAVLTSLPTGSTTATKTSIVGTYPITVSGGEAKNYTITRTNGTLTINKADISPSVSMSGWTYGSTASSPSVSGNSGSGTVTYQYKVSTAGDNTYTSTKPSNAGTYTVKATIAETTNYNGGTATTNFTIAKKAATLTCSTTELSFSASEKTNSTKTKTGVSCTDGTINVSSSDTNKCTVSYSNGTITVTRKTDDEFSVTITVSVTPTNTTNYTAPSNVTFTVSGAGRQAGDVVSDGDDIKVYTSATGGYKISKSDTSSGVWSGGDSWGTKAQWQEIFTACGGNDSSGYSVLNSKASGISGWTAMSGSYWSGNLNGALYGWGFDGNGWGSYSRTSSRNVRTVSAFTD